jgi:cytochrome c oxidase assembly protein subunit 15
MHTLTRWIAAITTAGMFVVLVMGATVTNTGSEHGCGRSWPLCHGQFIPQMAVSTAIEFSHRAIVGVESVLVFALAAAIFLWYRRYVGLRWLAVVMVLFLFLQAGLGAWAVMVPQSSAALALHFGVSLLAFASVLLAAIFLFELDGWGRLRATATPAALQRMIYGVTLYSYVVVYLGAFVRHTNADDACTGWPLCNGQVIPAFHGKVASNVTHRVAAGLLVIAVVALFMLARRARRERPDLFLGAALALACVVMQAVTGAFVEWTDMDLFSALAHASFVALMFGALTYLCMQVTPARLPWRVARRETSPPRGGRQDPSPATQ